MNIVQTIVDAITTMLAGLATGVISTFQTLFASGPEGGLSTFAIVALTMMGVGFVFGLFRFLMSKIGR